MKKRLEKTLKFIIDYIDENQISPSVREIQDHVRVGSSSTVNNDIRELKNMGYINTIPHRSRSITILKNPFVKDDILLENKEKNEDIIMVPKLGQVAAGEPIYAEKNIEDMIPMPSYMNRKGNLFFLNVKGESMINVGIYDGDNILVREQNTASNGEIIVAMVDDEVTVKRYYKRNNIIELKPENDTMESMYFDNIYILGKVVGLYRIM